jgi:hypothetical protein
MSKSCLLLVIILSLGLAGCGKKFPSFLLPVEGPQPTLNQMDAATKKVAADLGNATQALRQSTDDLTKTTHSIETSASQGKANLAQASQYFEQILERVKILYGVANDYAEVASRLQQSQQEVQALTALNQQAQAKFEEAKRVWGKQVEGQTGQVEKLQQELQKAKSDGAAHATRLLYGLMALGIVGVAAGVYCWFKDPKAGLAIIAGSGALTGLSLFVNETRKMWWWAALAAMGVGFIYGVYRLVLFELQRRKTEKEKAQHVADLNQALVEAADSPPQTGSPKTLELVGRARQLIQP